MVWAPGVRLAVGGSSSGQERAEAPRRGRETLDEGLVLGSGLASCWFWGLGFESGRSFRALDCGSGGWAPDFDFEFWGLGFSVIWFWGLGSALWILDLSSGLKGLDLGLG